MFLPLSVDTPRSRFPSVTLALIALNVLAFAALIALPPADRVALAKAAGAVPWELARFRHMSLPAGHPHSLLPPPLTIFTSMFIHADPIHLLGNMWFLWVFGSRLEGVLGALRFLALYLGVGALAVVLQVAAGPDVVLPMVGASGAIAGVLGAYAVALPRARVRCLVLLLFFVAPVRLSAGAMLGLWLLVQVASSAAGGGAVAYSAHMGGFICGAMAARLLAPPARLAPLVYHPA